MQTESPRKRWLWWLPPSQAPISSVQLGLWNTPPPRDQRTTTYTHTLLLLLVATFPGKINHILKVPHRHKKCKLIQKTPNTPQTSKVGFCRKSKKMCRICTFSSGPHMFPAVLIWQGYFPCKQPVGLSRVSSCPQACEEDPIFPPPSGQKPERCCSALPRSSIGPQPAHHQLSKAFAKHMFSSIRV